MGTLNVCLTKALFLDKTEVIEMPVLCMLTRLSNTIKPFENTVLRFLQSLNTSSETVHFLKADFVHSALLGNTENTRSQY